MTKADLIKVVTKEAKITGQQATKVVSSVTGAITKEMKKGGRISLPGFGTFSVSKRKARTGRNPRTGQEIKIPASKIVRFKGFEGIGQTIGADVWK